MAHKPAAAAASPARTIETRRSLSDTIARTLAEQQSIQQEDAAAVRFLSVPIVRGERGHVYPSVAARDDAWLAESKALTAFLQVDPFDYTTAALRMRPYGMMPRIAGASPQWWKRLPDGYGCELCPFDDVYKHRFDFDLRWRRFHRFVQGLEVGNLLPV